MAAPGAKLVGDAVAWRSSGLDTYDSPTACRSRPAPRRWFTRRAPVR